MKAQKQKSLDLASFGSEAAGKGLETQQHLNWLVHGSVMAGEDTCHQFR